MPKILARVSLSSPRDPHANRFTMRIYALAIVRYPAAGLQRKCRCEKSTTSILASCINAAAAAASTVMRCCCSTEQQAMLRNWRYISLSLSLSLPPVAASPRRMNQVCVRYASCSARTLTQRFLRITMTIRHIKAESFS